jgi:hypothetical protein
VSESLPRLTDRSGLLGDRLWWQPVRA